jgi:hypothetical protein
VRTFEERVINSVVEMGGRRVADRRGGVGRRLTAVRQSEGQPGEGRSDRQDAAREQGRWARAAQPGVDRQAAAR